MPRASTQQLVRSQLDAAVRHDERYLDLQIKFVRYKSGTTIARYGGRWDRRTKEFVGNASRCREITILCSYAVAVPDSIVWTVVPSEKFIEEPRKVIADAIMPSVWYEYNGSPQFTFYLVNGSQHVLLSGHKPSNLKKGKAALVGLNEAQQIRGESYRNARGASVDAGGFSIVAANPPIDMEGATSSKIVGPRKKPRSGTGDLRPSSRSFAPSCAPFSM